MMDRDAPDAAQVDDAEAMTEGEELTKALTGLQSLASQVTRSRNSDPRLVLALGDLMLELTGLVNHDARRLRKMTDHLGIGWSLVLQCRWIARRIPVGDALRKDPLSFAQLRALAGAEPDLRQELTEKMREAPRKSWSSRTLTREIQKRKDGASLRKTGCEDCGSPVEPEKAEVSFRLRNAKRDQYCCSLPCAARYFKRAAAEQQEMGNINRMDDSTTERLNR